MSSLVDPCNPFYASSACICTLGTIIAVQTLGPQMGCSTPLVDYLKFVTLFIIAYFSYENVIKGKPYRCGADALPMWSSICSCVILFSVAIGLLCKRAGGGTLGSIVGYVLTLIGCCITICCTARLFTTKGPFSSGFYNPSTLFSFQI